MTITIFNESCVNVMSRYAKKYDIIITSPPYDLYANQNDKSFMADAKYKRKQVEIFDQLYTKAPNICQLFYVHRPRHREGDYSHPLIWMNTTYWKIRQEIIWVRRFPQVADLKDVLRPQDERIIWLYKGEARAWNHPKDADMTTVWDIGHDGYPFAFPKEISDRILDGVGRENDLVFDPFMGSGTVGLSADERNLDFLGAEINPDIFSIAERELSANCEDDHEEPASLELPTS